MIVSWRAVIIGAIIVIVLAIIFGMVSLIYGPMMELLIAGIVGDMWLIQI